MKNHDIITNEPQVIYLLLMFGVHAYFPVVGYYYNNDILKVIIKYFLFCYYETITS